MAGKLVLYGLVPLLLAEIAMLVLYRPACETGVGVFVSLHAAVGLALVLVSLFGGLFGLMLAGVCLVVMIGVCFYGISALLAAHTCKANAAPLYWVAWVAAALPPVVGLSVLVFNRLKRRGAKKGSGSSSSAAGASSSSSAAGASSSSSSSKSVMNDEAVRMMMRETDNSASAFD